MPGADIGYGCTRQVDDDEFDFALKVGPFRHTHLLCDSRHLILCDSWL